MSGKLLTEHHLEFLGLKGGSKGSSESTLVKMPHCRKSRVTVQFYLWTQVNYYNTSLTYRKSKQHFPTAILIGGATYPGTGLFIIRATDSDVTFDGEKVRGIEVENVEVHHIHPHIVERVCQSVIC